MPILNTIKTVTVGTTKQTVIKRYGDGSIEYAFDGGKKHRMNPAESKPSFVKNLMDAIAASLAAA